MKITSQSFGEIGNRPIHSFTLVNDDGIEVTAINFGCIITKIIVPDKNGSYENIILGHDSLDEYINDPYFLGGVVGRVAGRIKGGSFDLDGITYALEKNDHDNHLHGGVKGFNKVIWDAEILDNGVRFSHFSRHGEGGYPGNLLIKVTYTLDNQNHLKIQYEAQADRKTLLTVTNHSYFNLSGSLKRDILHHTLTLKSDQFLELDSEFIPTGRFIDVKSTPFDFTKEMDIESGTTSVHPQNVLVGNGYDHPFLLTNNHHEEIVLRDPESGRVLTIETDEPAVVVYTGNSLKSEGHFRGTPSRKYLGICLETQALPDAIHQPHFPSVVLNENGQYSSETVYKFGIEKN